MTVDQIASLMECASGTVKSRLNYARQGIRKGVEEHERKGVRLYGVGVLPILTILLREQAGALLIPKALAGGLSAAVGTAAGAAAGTTAGSAAGGAGTGAAGTGAAGTGAAGTGAAGSGVAGSGAAGAVTTGTTAVTAGTTAATAGTTAATATGVALATKIIGGIVAATVLIGGGALLLTSNNNNGNTADTTVKPPSISTPATTNSVTDIQTNDGSQTVNGPDVTGTEMLPESSFYDTLSGEQKQMLSLLEAAVRAADYSQAFGIQSDQAFFELCMKLPFDGPEDSYFIRHGVYKNDNIVCLVAMDKRDWEENYIFAIWTGEGNSGDYIESSLMISESYGTRIIIRYITYVDGVSQGEYRDVHYDPSTGNPFLSVSSVEVVNGARHGRENLVLEYSIDTDNSMYTYEIDYDRGIAVDKGYRNDSGWYIVFDITGSFSIGISADTVYKVGGYYIHMMSKEPFS